ncbi:MAG: hypothetical protein AAFX90_20460 [Pseudomonadota bacterium]
MGNYGFGDDDDTDSGSEPTKIPLKSNRKTVAPEKLQEAAEGGADLGFVSREPKKPSAAKKPPRRAGRRQTEAQDKFLVTGPKRVLDAFKARCDEQNVPYWRMLEELMGPDGDEQT